MIDPSPIITPAFQLLSAVASVGRVRTKSYVVSRRFNALALGAVAADFAIKYLSTGRADHLVGLVVFTILTARTLMILCFESIEAEVFRRRVTCAVAFFACGVASVASQLAATGSLALVTLLPLVGIGMGCLGAKPGAGFQPEYQVPPSAQPKQARRSRPPRPPIRLGAGIQVEPQRRTPC